jgi:hypothetical protein
MHDDQKLAARSSQHHPRPDISIDDVLNLFVGKGCTLFKISSSEEKGFSDDMISETSFSETLFVSSV